jgi:ABC-2 type transport system ATP-binding protein
VRIEARGLGRRFGAVHALRAVDVDVPAGRRIGLVGPNGSGKSTLLRALVGLLRFEGDLRLGGLDPRRDRRALAGRLAYVPQIAPALAAPVAEIVRLVTTVRAASLDDVRRVAGALDFDLDERGTVPFRALSGGMKQKLLLALALSARAELIVLDEPTASLDAETRERFFELFAELPPTVTLVLCSHRIDEMRHLIDHVVALAEGRVGFDGAAEEYLRTRTRSVLEAHLADGADPAWLVELGFRRGLGGWWRRLVDQEQKSALLPRLAARLTGELLNLHVRDHESLGTDPVERS